MLRSSCGENQGVGWRVPASKAHGLQPHEVTGPPLVSLHLAELTAPAAADSLRHTDESPTETQETFAIKGVKMEAQAKAKPARPPRAHPVNPKRCQRAPKIRNYNFKD